MIHKEQEMNAQEIIIHGLVANFSQLADCCEKLGNLERAAAYRVAAFDCANVLTCVLGWMLDIQEKIKTLDS